MTIERIRETIKVHVKAAEASGKYQAALSLTELLDAIDAELVADGYFGQIIT